jgi:hypothetical protein
LGTQRGENAFEVLIPGSWKMHPVFNVSLFKKDRTVTRAQDEDRPPPLKLDRNGEEEYEVELILGHAPLKKTLQYLVKWKGYPEDDSSWVDQRELGKAARETVDEYHEKEGLDPPKWPKRSSRRSVKKVTEAD